MGKPVHKSSAMFALSGSRGRRGRLPALPAVVLTCCLPRLQLLSSGQVLEQDAVLCSAARSWCSPATGHHAPRPHELWPRGSRAESCRAVLPCTPTWRSAALHRTLLLHGGGSSPCFLPCCAATGSPRCAASTRCAAPRSGCPGGAAGGSLLCAELAWGSSLVQRAGLGAGGTGRCWPGALGAGVFCCGVPARHPAPSLSLPPWHPGCSLPPSLLRCPVPNPVPPSAPPAT